MGNKEEEKHPKPEKSSPPVVEQNNVHVYPDWASMQAYYPRLAVPPYMNSAVGPPHTTPPYMWGPPQSMIPPYGAPYAAFYAHSGIYPHPGIPVTGPALNMDATVKSSPPTDGGFVKKLKEFDGLAMSIGNGNGDSGGNGTDRKLSESEETEGSSDGSNGVASGAGKCGNKRNRQGSPNSGESKPQKKSSTIAAAESTRGSEKRVPVKTLENMNTASALRDPSDANMKSSPASVPQPHMLNEALMQNERELKRERRKQSNRESARRSRLRKQAEAEELAAKVQMLTGENLSLRSDLSKLMERSEKLKAENAVLAEKLKDGRSDQDVVGTLNTIDDVRLNPVGTVNLLARVNNSDSTDRGDEQSESYENTNRSPKAKLHQLLDAGPRTDAVAAG